MTRKGPPLVSPPWESYKVPWLMCFKQTSSGCWSQRTNIAKWMTKMCTLWALTLYSLSYLLPKTKRMGRRLESMYCSSLGNTEEIINIVRCWHFLLKMFLLELGFSLCYLSKLPVRTQGDLSMLNYPNKVHRTLMPKMPLVHSTTFADVWNNLT